MVTEAQERLANRAEAAVVQVGWPGATVSDTLQQITDRLERKLEETPNLDYLKSYTTPGQATVFVNLKDSTPAAQVPDIWCQVRKKVGDIRGSLPQGIVGPGFNDEFGDTYGIVYGFTADGFTHRELRDTVDDVRKQLLELPDISKIDVLGAQDERVYRRAQFADDGQRGLAARHIEAAGAHHIGPLGPVFAVEHLHAMVLAVGDRDQAVVVAGDVVREVRVSDAERIKTNGGRDRELLACNRSSER
jgi:AcrB/AcrD/AcrF family